MKIFIGKSKNYNFLTFFPARVDGQRMRRAWPPQRSEEAEAESEAAWFLSKTKMA